MSAGAVVPGWKVTEVIYEKLKALGDPAVAGELRLSLAMTDDQRTEIAAAAAVAVKLKFDVRERT